MEKIIKKFCNKNEVVQYKNEVSHIFCILKESLLNELW